jgi:hypothetical protein
MARKTILDGKKVPRGTRMATGKGWRLRTPGGNYFKGSPLANAKGWWRTRRDISCRTLSLVQNCSPHDARYYRRELRTLTVERGRHQLSAKPPGHRVGRLAATRHPVTPVTPSGAISPARLHELRLYRRGRARARPAERDDRGGFVKAEPTSAG